MKKFAVIVAGGTGIRMETSVPKQFLLLKDKPVLWYTLDTFLRAYDDMQIVLVLPEHHIKNGEQIAASLNGERINITSGGTTRFESVQCGLKLVKEPSVVFVHDGVRCLISVPLIQRCYKQALEKGSAVPAVASAESIRIMHNGKHFIQDRREVKIIQTPQTFFSGVILPAFGQPFNAAFTDEATVVEAYGNEIFLCEGEYNNIKITHPIDMFIAEKIIEERLLLKQTQR